MTDRVKMISIGAVFVVVAGVVFAVDPQRTNVFPICPFHRITGLWCPGCGATRAFHQLLHGNVGAALRFNSLAIVMLPLAGYLIARGDASTMKPTWIWALLLVVVAFGVLRNIPVYPFTLLAP
jgi:hypothetical protein